MPITVFQPRLLVKKPGWNSGKLRGTQSNALSVASTPPQSIALPMFPITVFLPGSSGWIRKAKINP